MADTKFLDKITIHDKMDFVHEVSLYHCPHLGFSTAYDDRGSIIGQVELNKIHQPISDNDHEWEMYEERLNEWIDEIKVNVTPMCKEHFNRKL